MTFQTSVLRFIIAPMASSSLLPARITPRSVGFSVIIWAISHFLLLLFLQDIGVTQEKGLLITQIATGSLLLCIYFYYVRRKKIHASDLGLRKPRFKSVLSVVGTYYLLAGAFFLILITITLAVILLTHFTPPEAASSQPSRYAGQNLLVVYFTSVILAPIIEEIIFRGLLFRSLARRWSVRLAAIASSLVFMATHLSTPQIALPSIFLLGLYLCWACRKTNSIVPGMIVHGLHNGAVITAALLLS